MRRTPIAPKLKDSPNFGIEDDHFKACDADIKPFENHSVSDNFEDNDMFYMLEEEIRNSDSAKKRHE